MPLRPGTYFVIAALIQREIMFLREGEQTLWSRTLRQARVFGSEASAETMKRQVRQGFSKFVVKSIQVVAFDIFGSAENKLVSLK